MLVGCCEMVRVSRNWTALMVVNGAVLALVGCCASTKLPISACSPGAGVLAGWRFAAARARFVGSLPVFAVGPVVTGAGASAKLRRVSGGWRWSVGVLLVVDDSPAVVLRCAALHCAPASGWLASLWSPSVLGWSTDASPMAWRWWKSCGKAGLVGATCTQ